MSYKILILFLVLAIAAAAYAFKNADINGNSEFISKDRINSSDVVIRQTENGYEPSEVTVKKGTRVVFLNETKNEIWPASNLHPTHNIFPEFDPKQPFGAGTAWGFVFQKTGEWKFHDHLRPNRQGVVKVTD